MARINNSDFIEFIEEEIRKNLNYFFIKLYNYFDDNITCKQMTYKYEHNIINNFTNIYIIHDINNNEYKVKGEMKGKTNFFDKNIKEIYKQRFWSLYEFSLYEFEKDNEYHLESRWIPKEKIGKTIVNMVIACNDFCNHWRDVKTIK
jgi:hypothetical protein